MIDKDLLKMLGKNKKYVFFALAAQIVAMLSNTGITMLICYCIYLLTKQSEANAYIYPIVGLVLAIIVRYICSRLIVAAKEKLGREVKKDLRRQIYDKIITLGAKAEDGIGMAGLTQISIEGVEQLDLYFSSYLPQFFYAMISPFLLFAICVFLDWPTALVLICCVPLIPISIIAVSKYAKKIFAKYWGKYISMGDTFLDSVQGLRDLKIFQADEKQHGKINESAEEFRKITMKVLVMQLASTTIMDLVAYGGAGAGIAIAIWGMTSRGLDPIICLFLCLVSVEFFLPLRAFGSAFHVAMNGLSAGKKILTLLALPDPVWGKDEVENTDIEFKNVTFSYNGERNVIENLNLDFPSHGFVAIVGESGCGKSTIVNLISGLLRPQSGEITVGGKKLESLSRENWYQTLGIVSYDTYLFNESILSNFKLAKQNATDEEIYSALKKVNLYDFVKEEGGLDKIINEDSGNISGGQRQRLCLAIALVADKKVYIFDEATSNIDVDSEKIIMDNVHELAKEKNVIVISHRLENVVRADKIYYLEEGQIQEEGTHEDLMKKESGYQKLYFAQKELESGYLREATL